MHLGKKTAAAWVDSRADRWVACWVVLKGADSAQLWADHWVGH